MDNYCRIEQADLVIMMVDANEFSGKCATSSNQHAIEDQFAKFKLPTWIADVLSSKQAAPAGSDLLFIANKIDLTGDASQFKLYFPSDTVYLSCKTGEGVERVVETLEKSVKML